MFQTPLMGFAKGSTHLPRALTMRVSLALRADLPPWQIKFCLRAAANQSDGQITSDFQKSCQAPKSKIFLFSSNPNQMHIEDVSSHQRGDRASSRARGGMRWTRRRLGRTAPVRTAKSCRSDAPRPASSLREEAQATVSSKPGQREEREISRKTIARGMPGDFRCDRGDYARVPFHIAREAAGALGTRHSLRPLIRGANGSCKTSGDQRRGIAEVYVKFEPRHCEEPTGRANARPMTGSATKQSILPCAAPMDCFAPLAMTVKGSRNA